MKLGHFFPALLFFLARGSIQHYTKWWLETYGFIPSLNTFAFDQRLGLVLIDVFLIYCPHDVLRCTARHESVWTNLAKGGLVCDVCFSMPYLFFFQYVHKLTLCIMLSINLISPGILQGLCFSDSHFPSLNAQIWHSILSVWRNLALLCDLCLHWNSCDCTGDIIFSKDLSNGLAGKGITSAVSLLFSGLLYLAAHNSTYPHYLQFSSRSSQIIYFSQASHLHWLAVPLDIFSILFGRRKRTMKLTFMLLQESQLFSAKKSMPEDTFLLASAHITSLCHCAPTAWTGGESLPSPCLIIGCIQSIKNPSAISSWNAAALAGVYTWELDKSWVEITDRCQWRKAGALYFHGKLHQWLFTCLRGWINWWYCQKMDWVK